MSSGVRPIARYAFECRLFDFFGGIVRCGFRSNPAYADNAIRR